MAPNGRNTQQEISIKEYELQSLQDKLTKQEEALNQEYEAQKERQKAELETKRQDYLRLLKNMQEDIAKAKEDYISALHSVIKTDSLSKVMGIGTLTQQENVSPDIQSWSLVDMTVSGSNSFETKTGTKKIIQALEENFDYAGITEFNEEFSQIVYAIYKSENPSMLLVGPYGEAVAQAIAGSLSRGKYLEIKNLDRFDMQSVGSQINESETVVVVKATDHMNTNRLQELRRQFAPETLFIVLVDDIESAQLMPRNVYNMYFPIFLDLLIDRIPEAILTVFTGEIVEPQIVKNNDVVNRRNGNFNGIFSQLRTLMKDDGRYPISPFMEYMISNFEKSSNTYFGRVNMPSCILAFLYPLLYLNQASSYFKENIDRFITGENSGDAEIKKRVMYLD